jgi:hypothetical protein
LPPPEELFADRQAMTEIMSRYSQEVVGPP